MKKYLLALALVWATGQAFAVYEVGDSVKSMCWTDLNGKQVCLADQASNVHVLVFNAGWCGPCNEEMDALSSAFAQFNGKPVTFMSLSIEGWDNGDAPDATFLSQWKTKHNIPFVVAASPEDPGTAFFDPADAIPAVVILDQQSKLAWKQIGADPSDVLSRVSSLLK